MSRKEIFPVERFPEGKPFAIFAVVYTILQTGPHEESTEQSHAAKEEQEEDCWVCQVNNTAYLSRQYRSRCRRSPS